MLQCDLLAPFPFIICLDCALITAISPSDGITLKKRQSSRQPEEVLSDLAYADDIAVLENVLKEAEDLLHRDEEASQSIGRLFLNAGKTKFMRLNPPSDDQMFSLDGSEIRKVDDFLSLSSYTETSHDIDTRIGKAWGGGASMLFLKYGYLQLRKQLKCACSKVKSSAYFSMGPTHGHRQNLWRKSSMARIHVMLRKVRNMS